MINALAIRLYTNLLQIREEFLKEERGAVDIVAIVILIAIAVALALFFKDQIAGLLSNLFTQIEDSTSGLTDPISS